MTDRGIVPFNEANVDRNIIKVSCWRLNVQQNWCVILANCVVSNKDLFQGAHLSCPDKSVVVLWDLSWPLRTYIVDGGNSDSAQIRLFCGYPTVLLTQCKNTNTAAFSPMLFASHASLNVANNPMSDENFFRLELCISICDLSFVTSWKMWLKIVPSCFRERSVSRWY